MTQKSTFMLIELLIIIILLFMMYMITNKNEMFTNNEKNAIVFFTYQPPKELFDFASKLKNNNYDIFVSINDNDYILPEYDKNINIIKLDETEVKNQGYFNSNINVNGVCSRDKAFYYFNRVNNTNYKHIWFIEEDVFIPTTSTIANIDKKYKDQDFMSNSYYVVDRDINNLNKFNINKDLFFQYYDNHDFFEGGMFVNIEKYFEFPWLKAMTCVLRVSKKYLKEVDNFVIKHKTLIFDEILFVTLALHKNLSIVTPIELSPVVYRCEDYNPYCNHFREDYIFHPIKDFNLQKKIRLKYGFK